MAREKGRGTSRRSDTRHVRLGAALRGVPLADILHAGRLEDVAAPVPAQLV